VSAADPSQERFVLLVDDDEDIREIVAEILADHGYQVRVAHNGREALAALDAMRTPPQLILLDLMMPEIDGAQFLAILDEHPVHAGIPIVVVTASRKTAPEAVRHKVAGWLPKPVEYDNLVATVSQFMDDKRPIAPVVPLRPKRTRDVGKFLERRLLELDTLQTALAASDHQEIRRIGHNLKGVGTSFGFPELSELGARLENAARVGDEPLMHQLVAELGSRVAKIAPPS
jgi:CheY-like chemotaxis protein